MPVLTADIISIIIFNMLQVAVGCILSVMICHLRDKKKLTLPDNLLIDTLLISLSSLAGVLLPLDMFGLIPVIATAVILGVKFQFIGSILTSNLVFNMLLPFTSTVFIWEANISRIAFSFFLGFIAGILLKLFKVKEGMLRLGLFGKLAFSRNTPKSAGKRVLYNMGLIIPFIVAGAIANAFFQQYVYMDLMTLFYTSPFGSSTTSYLMGSSSTSNPFFLLAMPLASIFTDLIKVTSILTVFRIRGLLLFTAYFGFWIALLTGITVIF